MRFLQSNQEIVVTDAGYKVLDVHKTDNESMFVAAKFHTVDGHELLTVRRSIRPGLQAEIVSYEYVEGSLREVSRDIDPAEVALPPHMTLSR